MLGKKQAGQAAHMNDHALGYSRFCLVLTKDVYSPAGCATVSNSFLHTSAHEDPSELTELTLSCVSLKLLVSSVALCERPCAENSCMQGNEMSITLCTPLTPHTVMTDSVYQNYSSKSTF